MKKQMFAAICFMIVGSVSAQSEFLERQKTKAKEKSVTRLENKIDNGIDKTLDKADEKISSAGKKKPKGGKEVADSTAVLDENPIESKDAETNETPATSSNSSSGKKGDNPSFAVYSKFDFVTGDKILVQDQFETTAIGDFPINWNTNASAEVVTIDGETSKFLKLSKQGVYLQDDIQKLPENFTLEYDIIVSNEYSENMSGMKFYMVRKQDQPTMFDQYFNSDTQLGFDVHPTSSGATSSVWVMDIDGNKAIENTIQMNRQANNKYHISIWRQKSRVRVYVNETKLFDLPRAVFDNVDYQIIFANATFEGELFIGNLKFAVGAPDTRSKLMTEGKLVSRGILFETNSDKIKPTSYGALKEVAQVLIENPTVKVKIIGHTDSDGENESNLTLSKKRALAVKEALVTEFKLDAARFETDGKGESEPAESNDTSVGKANNRRVEFLKI